MSIKISMTQVQSFSIGIHLNQLLGGGRGNSSQKYFQVPNIMQLCCTDPKMSNIFVWFFTHDKSNILMYLCPLFLISQCQQFDTNVCILFLYKILAKCSLYILGINAKNWKWINVHTSKREEMSIWRNPHFCCSRPGR